MSDLDALVLAEVRNGVGHVTLNRPQAYNALNLAMVRLLQQQLKAWANDSAVRAVVLRATGEKAFCAGGDIRELYDNHLSDSQLNETFFSEEYALDYFIHTYPKPFIALVDGLVLGGGMGLVQGAKYRLVTEKAKLGMPEVAIGYFPDVGGSYFLSRLPDETGTYMGVTGNSVSAADALALGLADWYLAQEQIAEFDRCLDTMQWGQSANESIRSLLETLAAKQLAGSALQPLRPLIQQHFSFNSLAEIVDSLSKEPNPEHQGWANATLDTLRSRSPMAMAGTLELLRRGRQLSLADCFRLEFHLDCQWFDKGDFMEGVRALIIDKDKNPQWNPSCIEELQQEQTDALFAGFRPSSEE